MEYVRLGKTGLRVSRLGFGGIPIQRVDREKTKALMGLLAQAGVNYIDTARGYTVSEEFLGYALEGIRDQFILATKSMGRTREEMARDINVSLKNLRTDYIDLYQIHNPTPEQLEQVTAPGGALEALLEAKAAGKIRHIGLTAHSLDVFRAALETDWAETVMFPYNIVENQGEDLIRQCAGKDIGFIAMKPLAGGAIEDASLALRFVCANPHVSVVIPGMAEPAELAQNLDAVNHGALSPADEGKLAWIRNSLGTQFCRRCDYCQPCTAGIHISSVFLFDGYLRRYGLADWAKARYDTLSVPASACVGCGLCESRCPYQLPIRELLSQAAARFGK